MHRILFAFIGFVFVFVSTLQAQAPGRQDPSPGGEVGGRVIEASGQEPLHGASVAVWRGDAIVSGDIAHEDGAFRVQGLPPGTYHIQVTSIGYDAHRTADFTIAPGAAVEIGTIRMTPSPVAVEGIEVEVEKPTVAIEPDRNSYAAKDVAPAAASASEVLEAVPSVAVDQDGKVSLRGNENVAIHINGRPAPVQGDQLAGYLRQLPANVIERVEVVPTPSARYDPEGMAGIVNIVMKENVDLGTSGGFTLAGSPQDRYNASATFGYQRGPMTLFSNYGFNSDQRSIDGINDRLRFDALDALLSSTLQDVVGENGRSGHNVGTTLDLRLSERDVLTNILSLNSRRRNEESINTYTELDAAGTPLDHYDRARDGESHALTFDYTLAFKRTLEARRHEISAEARFDRSDDDDVDVLWRQPADATSPASRTELERRERDDLERELTGQFDYTRGLGERSKLELGWKGEGRWLDQGYRVSEDPPGTGTWVPSDLSNAFEFNEHVEAAYGVLSHGVGKFELQGGLRVEHASRDFVLAADGQSFPYDYNSLFPSGVVSYAPNDADEWKIAYSRRIDRPGTEQLNPFPTFFDVQNVFLGNPELDPEYTNAIEFGYTHQADWGMWQLSPFYRRTTDIIRFIVDTDDVVDGREVTTVSFENLDTSDSWGTDVNAQLELGGWLNAIASFNVFKMVTDGGSETSLSSNAVSWSTRFNATAKITPNLSLQGMTFYRAPMEFETGKFSSWKMTMFTLKQEFSGDRASLSLRVVDPFDVMGFRVEAGDDNLTQITERKFDARSMHLTFQYTFGKAPRVREPRPDTGGGEPAGGFPQ